MIKLLVVDDEKMTREGLLHHIPWRELGIDMVRSAEDGLQAIRTCDTYKPDIVLTDVKMPVMDGIEFAGKLRDSLPDCVILFLSSYADKTYLKSAIQLHALDYIEKPVDLEELKAHLRRAVAVCLERRDRRSRENRLEQVVSESRTLWKEKIALQWIGGPEDAAEARRDMERAGIDIPSGARFVTAVMKLCEPDADLQSLQARKNEALATIETTFGSFGLACVCGFKDTQHLIVHAYSPAGKHPDPDKLVGPAGLVRDRLGSMLGRPVRAFTGIGVRVQGAERILDSYRAAVVAVQRQFFAGYNRILVYRELGESDFRPLTMDESTIAAFASLLAEGRMDDAAHFVRRLVERLRGSQDVLVGNAKNFFFQLLLALFRAADQQNVPLNEERRDDDFLWNVIFRFHILDELETYALDKLALFSEQLKLKENEGSIAYHIRKIVLKHLQDSELSIKTIADALYLTPNYLSLQFKKETGLTINQFLTESRIERAQELLKDRRYKLYEVASLVGFQDANYFAKTFKKVTGMTPSEYKEKFS
ncbi:response regulator [Cohnella sp. CFH 77786]|uniref:response regulator n=1 Tax=Cohnella sp. CFH 77786 TaxID=2662265 RepID=UPI001C609C2E|nr:response regulator [Cohnella sp. CFH 77786]MBW5447203.1 response regulator [Cohnella sp. CFH 77786]